METENWNTLILRLTQVSIDYGHIFKNIAEIPVWVWGGVENWCRHYGN